MKVSTKITGLESALKVLGGLNKRVFEIADIAAKNDAAFAGYKAARDKIPSVFDRPTPWILSGVRYHKASKTKPYSEVGLNLDGNKQGVNRADVLQAEIFGGARRQKRHELALRAAGVLPPGMFIAPGPAAIIDRYGNMSAGQIVQIISWFDGFERAAGARQNMSDERRGKLWKGKKVKGVKQRGFRYFVLTKPQGKLRPGIYLQKNYQSIHERARIAHLQYGGAKAVMFFVRQPQYRKRFDLFKVVDEAAVEQYRRSINFYVESLQNEAGR
ncbi:MAG: hypothetical protein PHD19_08830 [Dechloromonas sp.]|nr:hypothetical protein [Dechloromonas sp.]